MAPPIREIFWDPSPAQDVVKHRIYYAVGQDNHATKEDPYIEIPGDQYSVTLDRVIAESGEKDALFSFAVSAIDDVGWESDLYEHPDWVSVPLDVEPPAPVSGGGIRDLST